MLVPWCSGYRVCFIRRRSRDRSPREPFAIFLSPVCKNLHWCAGSPAGAVVIASASHAEGLGFYPRGNLLPSFCDMYVKLKASIYYIDQEKMCWFPGVVGYHVCFTRRRSRVRSPREPFAIFLWYVCEIKSLNLLHWSRKGVLVPWCSGYHVCFTRRRSRDRSPREPFVTYRYVTYSVHWCAGSLV